MDEREALNKWWTAKDAKVAKQLELRAAKAAYAAAGAAEELAWQEYCELLRGSEGKRESNDG